MATTQYISRIKADIRRKEEGVEKEKAEKVEEEDEE